MTANDFGEVHDCNALVEGAALNSKLTANISQTETHVQH